MFTRIALALFVTVLVSHPSEGQTLKIRMGVTSPVGTAVWRGAELYRDAINNQLDGLARLELLPYGSMDVWTGISSGLIEMAVVNSSMVAAKAPQLALLDLPFFFRHLREVAAVQETLIGEVMLGSVNQSGLVGLAYWNAGMSQLFGKATIESTEQLKGIKFRTTVSGQAQVAARELGLTTVSLPFAELVPAVERGVIDLVELPPVYVTQKVLPLAPTNHTDLNYRPVVSLVLANTKFWRSARVRVQTALVEQSRIIAQRINTDAQESEKTIAAQLIAMRFKTVTTNQTQFDAFAKAAEAGWGRVEQVQANGFLDGALAARNELRRVNYELPSRRSDPASTGPRMTIGFATDRRDDKDADPTKRFSAARGNLTFGHADVVLDPNRPFGTGDVDHVRLAAITDRPSQNHFVEAVKSQLAQSQRKEILLYIHGFRTLFKSAIESAAQIATDTKFQGATVVFSWPSDGTVSGYSSDGEDIDDSRDNFITVLKALSSAASPTKLHVVAHSMGGRLPAASLEMLATRPQDSRPKLYHLVLAAADVRINQFKRALPGMQGMTKKVTMYASEWDQALQCSLWLNSNPRVGQGGSNVVVVANVDTIDVSAVEKPWFLSPGRIPCTPFGHSHTSQNQVVLADLYNLLANDTAPNNRQRLHEQKKEQLPYWLLK